jgi:hypothetical protein
LLRFTGILFDFSHKAVRLAPHSEARTKTDMNSMKLHEALAEIEAQQRVLRDAAESIRKVLVLLHESAQSGTPAMKINDDSARCYVDAAAAIVREHGKAMHVMSLLERICADRCSIIKRTSFEASLSRHIAKAKVPKLAKFGPSTYGLPEWKTPPVVGETA